MKVKLDISSEILEDMVTIEAQSMSEQITHLVTYIQNLDKRTTSLTVKKGEQIYLVDYASIVRLYLEDKIYRWKLRRIPYFQSTLVSGQRYASCTLFANFSIGNYQY